MELPNGEYHASSLGDLTRRSYLLITPAKNEEHSIRQTIESVLSQTVLPTAWVIIDDCSTDATASIVQEYATVSSFITLIRKTGNGQRNFGSKVEAINRAYAEFSGLTCDYVGNLDADVTFAPDYFARVLQHFLENPKLGIGGGIISEKINHAFHEQRISANSVAGAVQLFRRRCWEDVGGYVPIRHGGIDAVAEISARMHGWEVATFPELKVLHHRRVGLGGGSLVRARFKEGTQAYHLGYHPLFQIAKCSYRIVDRPYVVGSVAQILGYFHAFLKKEKTAVPAEVKEFAWNEQRRRLVHVLTGRKSALQG